MDFLITKAISGSLVKALCNTLIYSLGQGILLAAIAGLIIVLTRKSTPVRRYNLLLASMVLFAIASVSTFVIEFNHAATEIIKPVNQQGVVTYVTYNKPVPNAITNTTLVNDVLGFFNKNANIIVMIWFLVVSIRCLQMLTGLQGLYYLRRRAAFVIDKEWEHRVQQLAVKLGIRQLVGIAESGLAKVPMVIGYLKPLILIPVGMITLLPPEEIEAILIHELAHIKRRDYLVNLLQSLMEIVFFFNPAVFWISALVRTERENCCDDIAVAESTNKVSYIKALVACQEYQLSSPAYAMAINGKKNHLLARVKRMISNNNQSLNMIEKSLLAICLVMAGLCTAAFSNAANIHKLVTNTAKAVSRLNAVTTKSSLAKAEPLKPGKIKPAKDIHQTDTLAQSQFKVFQPSEIGDHTSFQVPNGSFNSVLYKENGILYQLNYKNKTLSSLQVDGKTIPKDQIANYQPVIDQIPHQTNTDHVELTEKAAVAEVAQSAKPAKVAVSAKPAKIAISATPAGVARPAESVKPAKPAQKADTVYIYDTKTLYHLDTASVKLKRSELKLNSSIHQLNWANGKLNSLKDLAIADSVNQGYKRSGQGYKKTGYQYSTKYDSYKPQVSLKDDERRDKVINDMMKDRLITTRDNLSFKISTDEFIVNGKKQPEDVYQRYRAKYVKITGHEEWSWLYNYDTNQHRESNTVTDNKN